MVASLIGTGGLGQTDGPTVELCEMVKNDSDVEGAQPLRCNRVDRRQMLYTLPLPRGGDIKTGLTR